MYNTVDSQASTPSDEELVARIRDRRAGKGGGSGAGGARDTEMLFGRYTSSVYLHCLRILKGRDQALDASQDVLTRLFERLDRFDRERSRFSSWVFAITRNHCFNVVRDQRVRDGVGRVDLDALISSDQEPDAILETEEQKSRLALFMDGVLDPLEKTCLWMRYAEAVPVDEITRLLGVEGASGARGLLQKARRKLRAARSDWLEEGGDMPKSDREGGQNR